jgi:tetraacyldisaccharide 4'-kinase
LRNEAVRRQLTRVLNSLWYGQRPAGRLLRPLGSLYCRLAERRRARFLDGRSAVIALPVPVVVVGNLTVGGTGKTPLIIWLAEQLVGAGLRVGVISRGYRGRARDWPRSVDAHSDPREVGDEPVLIARRSGCAVAVAPDRVAAARHLLARADCDVLLADDGLQHYRLGRCFEIAVVDGVRGLGNGQCLPAGPLREPASRLDSVDTVVINGGAWSRQSALRARLVATRVVSLLTSEVRPLASFAGQTVHALAGIGRPAAFFELLEQAGLIVIARALDDHAPIRAQDLVFDAAGAVLMTEKDAVKCRGLAHPDCWAVVADLQFDANDGQRLLASVRAAIEDHAA